MRQWCRMNGLPPAFRTKGNETYATGGVLPILGPLGMQVLKSAPVWREVTTRPEVGGGQST